MCQALQEMGFNVEALEQEMTALVASGDSSAIDAFQQELARLALVFPGTDDSGYSVVDAIFDQELDRLVPNPDEINSFDHMFPSIHHDVLPDASAIHNNTFHTQQRHLEAPQIFAQHSAEYMGLVDLQGHESIYSISPDPTIFMPFMASLPSLLNVELADPASSPESLWDTDSGFASGTSITSANSMPSTSPHGIIEPLPICAFPLPPLVTAQTGMFLNSGRSYSSDEDSVYAPVGSPQVISNAGKRKAPTSQAIQGPVKKMRRLTSDEANDTPSISITSGYVPGSNAFASCGASFPPPFLSSLPNQSQSLGHYIIFNTSSRILAYKASESPEVYERG